jgi:hypothetical protein
MQGGTMSNLRNPNLRTRDIRKLIGYKYQSIKWDKGIEERNEWNLASLESEVYSQKLLEWLKSKNILLTSEALLVEPSWLNPKTVTWQSILLESAHYFCGNDFQLYDLDLNWVLEYKSLGVVRFGRIEKNA